jgi:Obg family GTPase CgtA
MPKYGGIGGQGGAIFFEAKEDVTLRKLWRKYPNKQIKAGHGEDSNKARILGRRGIDEKIEVPLGVTIIDDEERKVISELNEEGQRCLGAGGGTGGCAGNQFIGDKGQQRIIKLDLKLIADVGLVGFPNAGKSTLLKAVSRTNPKIASYPFTTIMPQIGTIEYEDYRQITVADLPGLIEGAHRNIGMGHQFLKHVERTKLLLLIIDVFGFQLSVNHMHRNCLENVYSLNKELELYDPTLLEKPSILLVNKMDTNGSNEEFMRYEKFFKDLSIGLNECPKEIRPNTLLKFDQVIPISAKSRTGIHKVTEGIRDVLDIAAEQERLSEEVDQRFDDKIERKLREYGPKVV